MILHQSCADEEIGDLDVKIVGLKYYIREIYAGMDDDTNLILYI